MEKEYELHRKMLEAVGMYGTYLTEIRDKADIEGDRHGKRIKVLRMARHDRTKV